MSHDAPLASEPGPGRPQRPMRFAGCAIVLAIAALLLGLAVAAFPAYVRYEALRGQDPWETSEVERFVHEPLHFPPEWCEAKPFSASFRRELEALEASWQKRAPNTDALLRSLMRPGYRAGRASTPAEIATSKTLLLATLRPQFQQLRRTLASEGYDLEAFDMNHSWQCGNLPTAAQVTCLLRYDLETCVHNQSYDEALLSSLLLLGSLKRHPACSYWTHDAALFAMNRAMEPLTTAALATTQSAMLARVLGEMNRLDPLINLNTMERYTQLQASLGSLRAAKRQGYPYKIPSPGNAACIYAYQLRETKRKFPAWMLERLSPNDPDRKGWEEALRWAAPRRSWTSWSDLRQRYAAFKASICPEFFYQIPDIPRFQYAVPDEQEAKARYDLTRLLLAQRLAELSGEATSASLGVLVPRERQGAL